MNLYGRTPKQQAAYEADQKRRAGASRLVDEFRQAAPPANKSPRIDSHISTAGGLSGVIRPAR